MKTANPHIGWRLLTALSLTQGLSVSALSPAAPLPGKSIWLARITGQTQCERDQEPPALSAAVSELERLDATVLVAKLGARTDLAFCQACTCEKNLFHVAKITADPQAIEIAEKAGWVRVDPETVGAPVLTPSPSAPSNLR